MKAKVLLSIATLTFVYALAAGVAMSSAAGSAVSHLQGHGWTCPTPGGLPHCRPPGLAAGAAGGLPEISILVFDQTGTQLLGTEHLVRPDLYNGQPCPQDPDPVTGGYTLLGNGYYGCHHFALPS